jgi:hypothetical protein
MSFISIGAWRTRRKDRKADELIALAGRDAKDRSSAKTGQVELDDHRHCISGHEAPFVQHAAEEGKTHY